MTTEEFAIIAMNHGWFSSKTMIDMVKNATGITYPKTMLQTRKGKLVRADRYKCEFKTTHEKGVFSKGEFWVKVTSIESRTNHVEARIRIKRLESYLEEHGRHQSIPLLAEMFGLSDATVQRQIVKQKPRQAEKIMRTDGKEAKNCMPNTFRTSKNMALVNQIWR